MQPGRNVGANWKTYPRRKAPETNWRESAFTHKTWTPTVPHQEDDWSNDRVSIDKPRTSLRPNNGGRVCNQWTVMCRPIKRRPGR